MPRKRKPSTPTFRRPLPFVASPLQASPRNPPSPLKPNISPPEARSVPIDCLSETEYLILPCSQLTTASSSSSSTRSKRRSPRLQCISSSVASTRTRRGGGGVGSGGGRGRKKTPPKPTNKAPVVSVMREGNVDSGKNTRLEKDIPRSRTRSFGQAGAEGRNDGGAAPTETLQDATNQELSPDMLLKVRRRSSNARTHSRRESAENVVDKKDDENFLQSRNLLKTPPSRNSRQRTFSPAQTSPQLPLANVINTPEIVADLRDTGVTDFASRDDAVEEDDVVVPDTYPSAGKNDSTEAEGTFLTPQRKKPVSQVLVPETPIAEMGLTYVEKSAIARRRLREARQDAAR